MKAGSGTSGLWWALGGLVVVGLLLGAVTATAVGWRDALVAEQRVLPGTVVAGAEVGLRSAGDLRAVVREASEAALDRTVTLVHGDRRWDVSARDVEATTDGRDVVASALDASASASPWHAAAARWLGRGLGFERDVRAHVPRARAVALVEALAASIDRQPVDATLTWHNGELHLRESRAGARLDRAGTVERVARAFEEGGEVDLEVASIAPALPSERLEGSLPAVREAVHAALDRPLTVRHEGSEWRVTPRELDAVPDPRPFVEAALEGDAVTVTGAATGRADGAAVPLRLPPVTLAAWISSLAADVDRDPEDAWIDHSSGRIDLHADVPGVAVDREAAAALLREALDAGAEAVDLPVSGLEADVTAADYRHVLLVRLDERRLYLYVDGAVAREWPVAVGAPGSQTPTGTFTVGHKRHMPTWYNPAPEGWGADMPAIIGPGPSNPLGVRALNWNSGGRDTLIRFHGTSEVSSIGRAASRGCVRLTNGDVVELYDLVAPGTTIVSLNG